MQHIMCCRRREINTFPRLTKLFKVKAGIPASGENSTVYTLTLTGDERNAFDFVGNRYPSGNAMADILRECLPLLEENDDRDLWNEPGNVTFQIPEYNAWEIQRLYEADCEGGHSGFPLFNYSLKKKMIALLDSIV